MRCFRKAFAEKDEKQIVSVSLSPHSDLVLPHSMSGQIDVLLYGLGA